MSHPAYLQLSIADVKERAKEAQRLAQPCRLCPQGCDAQRQDGEAGLCGLAGEARVASFGPHPGEERPLRGWRGSGTIFFAGCNLKCVYCQNYEISHQVQGRPADSGQLASMMLRLQRMGCHNINLVSPSHVVCHWLAALVEAIEGGLRLPIVYNSGGYDSLETLDLLDSIVDIYMPDMKYGSNDMAHRYSKATDYVGVNQRAVKAMHDQVGDLVVDAEGIAQRGLIIRHLLLPGDVAGTGEVLAFIASELGPNTYLNLMNQYTPHYLAHRHKELKGRVSIGEYQAARRLAARYGLTRLD